MQVHEITRSAYIQTLHGLDVLAYLSEARQGQIKQADWVIVRMPVYFGHVCKYASLLYPYDCEACALDNAVCLEKHELSRLGDAILESTNDHPVLYATEVWHIIDDEPNDDVYVCYIVEPFLSEQTEDGYESCAGEILFEDYEQALCCAKRLVNIQNPEGYKGIPYQTKMFHHVALTRDITDFSNDLIEEKTLCVLMPRMNRKYLGMKILGCEVNRYQEHDLGIVESLRQMREAAVV